MLVKGGRILALAVMLTSFVLIGEAAPASAGPQAGRNDAGALAANVFFCTDIAPNALCTTTNARLNLRTGMIVTAPIIMTMANGARVWLHCWAPGDWVNGDYVWYKVTEDTGHTGWAAGYYLNTGADPHPWVPPCPGI